MFFFADGNYKIPPILPKAFALDTKSIRVRWNKVQGASFYVVKVFNGFEGGFVKSVRYSGKRSRPFVIVKGLFRGTPYVVTGKKFFFKKEKKNLMNAILENKSFHRTT